MILFNTCSIKSNDLNYTIILINNKMLRKSLIILFAKTSVNKKQMDLFNRLVGWWHPSGPSQVLYTYNYHRIQFLRKYLIHHEQRHPLKGMDVLDVGCGAGFLTQSLTRLGGNVIGLDPNTTSFNEACVHKGTKQDLKSLKYENESLEKFIQSNKNIKFDLITSMQVLQHVNQPQQFIKTLSTCTREGGLVMLSTIRRSASSWLKHIVAAETFLGIVPQGTHHHNKFINPQECQVMLSRNGYETLQILQLELNWKGQFQKEKDGNNYLIIAKKK